MIFGRPIYRYTAVASTQDIARDLSRAGEPPGTVVTAESQTQGRGRRGRQWHAAPGANVMLTAICPPVPLGVAWQIALLAGVAVAEAVQAVVPAADARVRFPNDVLVQGRKLAGILVETAFGGDPERVVPLLGIGLNVKAGPLPPEIARRAVSLEETTDKGISVPDVEAAVLQRLGSNWELWTSEGMDAILAAWRSLSDPEARRTFVLDGESTLCRVVEIAADGATTLETEDRRTYQLAAGHVILGDD